MSQCEATCSGMPWRMCAYRANGVFGNADDLVMRLTVLWRRSAGRERRMGTILTIPTP